MRDLSQAFNDCIISLFLQDEALYNATMCAFAAESAVRGYAVPGGTLSVCPPGLTPSKSNQSCAFTQYEMQAIATLNQQLRGRDTNDLSIAHVCAVMFLLWAEVSPSSTELQPLRHQRSCPLTKYLSSVLPWKLPGHSCPLIRLESDD